ncbi:urease subunit gamma [Yinghuangia seranimata]|uniref:urease subunit gamma n=1 Tax=Yinghuangia seranimata TaxID=408067 RepID=UPI00248BF839|nr:urease subunit gamma [Yinghuangia seranimata]MDI2126007.1 urease subunit gamma [Yinghuangia seranimata]
MRLTPTERDRLLISTAAERARARRARGLRLNVPEAHALIADTVCEAARDGVRLAEAIDRARTVLGPDDVLPGVGDIVGEVKVEAVFDDATRLAVVTDPVRSAEHAGALPTPTDRACRTEGSRAGALPTPTDRACRTEGSRAGALPTPTDRACRTEGSRAGGFAAPATAGPGSPGTDAPGTVLFGPQPGAHGAAPAERSVAFTSQAADNGGDHMPTKRRRVGVRGTRGIGPAAMRFNNRVAEVRVAADTGLVTLGGAPVTSGPAESVSPNRLYFP